MASQYDADLLDENLAFQQREQAHKTYREFILEEIDAHERIHLRLVMAVRAGDVAATLRVLADDICYWAGNLKQHLLHHVSHYCKDPTFIRMRSVPENAPFRFMEIWLVRNWIGSHEAFDLLEFHKSTEYAQSFSARLDQLHDASQALSKLLTKYTVESNGEIEAEDIFALDEQRKELKHQALWLAEHIDVIATQFDAAKSSTWKSVSATDSAPPHANAVTADNAVGTLPWKTGDRTITSRFDELSSIFGRSRRGQKRLRGRS